MHLAYYDLGNSWKEFEELYYFLSLVYIYHTPPPAPPKLQEQNGVIIVHPLIYVYVRATMDNIGLIDWLMFTPGFPCSQSIYMTLEHN